MNVIGRRAGRTRRQIVVVSERDAEVTPGCDRERRGHGGAARAGAGVRRPGHAQDARARLDRRLDPRRGGRDPPRGGARRSVAGGRRHRRVRSRLAHAPRALRAGLVERLPARRYRAPTDRGGLHPPGAEPRRGFERRPRPARAAGISRGRGGAGPAPRARLRCGPGLRERRAAAEGQRTAGRRRRGPDRHAGTGDVAYGHGRRPARPAGAWPGDLPAGREPGRAGLGAGAALRNAAAAAARRERRCLRPRAPPAGGRAPVGALARCLGCGVPLRGRDGGAAGAVRSHAHPAARPVAAGGHPVRRGRAGRARGRGGRCPGRLGARPPPGGSARAGTPRPH